jgi:hypothetical protein
MNANITQLLEKGYELTDGEPSSSFVGLQKRNSNLEVESSMFYCNLSVKHRSGEVVQCVYNSERRSNMLRHVTQAQKHHKWKTTEGLETMVKKVKNNEGTALIFIVFQKRN